MTFYDLTKQERTSLVQTTYNKLLADLRHSSYYDTMSFFADDDSYIRKSAYLVMGRIYFETEKLQPSIIKSLKILLAEKDYKIRQTVINAAGEIGKKDFEIVQPFFDNGLFDRHHSPRNAVIGSVKKMGEVNPKPLLAWARKYLHHPDKEIRREICHGIELRGRKHPEDILPLLKELQHDKTSRVRNTLVHVIGQISYKKGCLQTVIAHLKTWENKHIVTDAIEEIIDVHARYEKFSFMTQQDAINFISKNT